MQFTETTLQGAFVVDIEQHEDERGFFARSWCAREFRDQHLNPCVVQCDVSWNRLRGTLRGMHYQVPPHAEVKLVRCTRGAVYDVIIDLRETSPTFRQHFALELSGDNHRALYIPEGFAHGFLTLRDDSEVFYQMSAFYEPGALRGVRWNDPAFGVSWPLPVSVISDRDRNYADFMSIDGTRAARDSQHGS
jgi:dTDP-4-dehydrorhamnose 3,5-epimerase